jgi:hypothetical protein
VVVDPGREPDEQREQADVVAAGEAVGPDREVAGAAMTTPLRGRRTRRRAVRIGSSR